MPASVTSLPTIVVGLLCFSAALFSLVRTQAYEATVIALLCMIAYAFPVAALELARKVYRRPSAGLGFERSSPSVEAVYVKLAGYFGTLAVVALVYWLFPEYERPLYEPFWRFLKVVWPAVFLAVPYFIVLDRFMREKRDGYWHAGLLFLGRWGEIDRRALRHHILEWIIKGFFLPIMFADFILRIRALTDANYAANFLGFFNAAYHFLYALDGVAVCTGYILTMRLLDSHIRSVEPTAGGWAVGILCYGPFWALAWTAFFNYERGGTTWGPWLTDYPVLQVLWGGAILVFTAIYALANASFGLRFSNLTHRGIITNGVYGVTKHPSYVAKNITWWLISVPFIASSGADAVRNCLLLFAVNVIYFLRARTEERHLSRDPDYVAYAMAMNARSIFAPLGRVLPFLQYKPPASHAHLLPVSELQGPAAGRS